MPRREYVCPAGVFVGDGQLLVNYSTKQSSTARNDSTRRMALYSDILNGTQKRKS